MDNIKSFGKLNLKADLIEALKKDNITIPTDVQSKVIPQALTNKDLIVKSQTGTGKTLAYLLPLFEKIDSTKKELNTIILVPTHELAVQVQRQIEKLAQNSENKISSALIIGNVNITRQIEKLKEKPQIIVGSSGRILELIKKKKINAQTVKSIILDEADRLMDKNNITDVLAVIKTSLKDRQILMFSATMSQKSIAQAREIMKEPDVIISEESIAVPTGIEHVYFLCEQRDKIEVLRKLVRIFNPEKAIVFTNNSNDIDIYTSKLKFHGISAESIHGSNVKLDRKKTMEDFRKGRLQLLIASDIAARGLDIEEITHIFNLDMPENPENYLHRAGRTGRKGNSGTAVSIVTEREIELIKSYERALKISFLQKYMFKGEILDAKKKHVQKPLNKEALPQKSASKSVKTNTNSSNKSKKSSQKSAGKFVFKKYRDK